jgi:2-methylcitrate dehydratase PrpD
VTDSTTRDLARWAADLTFDAIPPTVVERAKLISADIFGIMLRARHESESTPPLIAALDALGETVGGRFHIVGSAERYSAIAAARLNATNAHSIELDDTYSPRGLHTSCCVVPAALAAAEIVQAGGRDVVTGIVAGLEAMCRVGLGLGGRSVRGFHATPICGGFGAAAAAGRVLGLSAEQMENAFGIVLSETAGNMQFHVNGAWTKRSQIGHACASGLTSAVLARHGYTGPSQALEGDRGLFRLYADAPAPELVLSGLETDWQILEIAFKPHAACRGTHAAIDAAIAIRNEEHARFEDLDRVEVGLPRAPLDLIALLAEPEDRKRQPQTTVDGQFSIHFCVDVALRLGRLDWDDYATQFWDPSIRALMQRTSVFHDRRAIQVRNGSAAGSVRVRLRDGRFFERLVTLPKGEPENMLTIGEVHAKFDSLTGPYVSDVARTRAFELILHLESERSLDGLFECVASSRSRATR